MSYPDRSFLASVLKRFLPSSHVEVFPLPMGGVEARVRYSDMDWAENTTEENVRRVYNDLVPRQLHNRRRRLHWGKRK